MSRIPRHFPQEGVFHVLARGNNRASIFHQPADYLAYTGIFRNTVKEFPISLHHYCLMPNHIHLLLSAGPPASVLSDFMRRVQLSYTIYYKAHHEHIGHLWQDRYKCLWIDSERYFFTCGAYIELNPVVAGLVRETGEYVFSSYRHYALGVTDSCITPHFLYEQMGSTPQRRQEAYRALVVERMLHREEDQFSVGFQIGQPGRPSQKRDRSVPVPISFGR